ncbi:hypothetical protein EIP91_007570 [Steccherinum ochraceum]|uniref:Uncharacterized protein n=1 Tax=Steccherinum ochraceum TaxID=92696 RepID=A0A4R0S0P5_9APHY|nr:hypothetical protein EIP91_007570 [Steccherinum ochraceum]
MPYIEPVLDQLNRVLRTLYQLESLDLALGLSGGTIGSRGILNECHFPYLRLFALSGVGRGTLSPKFHPSPTPPIEWFLNATPSIQHLRLADCYEALKLEPTDLPLLSTFRGSAPTAASVLPGRPVQFLSLVGHEFVTDRDLARIACSSAKISWLDLSSMSVTPILLRDISRHLIGVECLKLKLALRHTLHHALSGIVSALLLSSRSSLMMILVSSYAQIPASSINLLYALYLPLFTTTANEHPLSTPYRITHTSFTISPMTSPISPNLPPIHTPAPT